MAIIAIRDTPNASGSVSSPLSLDPRTREEIWKVTLQALETYAAEVDELPVRPRLDPHAIRAQLSQVDFSQPLDPVAAVDFAVELLRSWQTHTSHARYFGLFDPAPAAMGVVAEALIGGFNPQLAAWSQSPAAVEMEQFLLRSFGELFGYHSTATVGAFTSGGAEANHMALLVALTAQFTAFAEHGLLAQPARPVFYMSKEAHHSLVKAARLCGLGTASVREIKVDHQLAMDVDALSQAIDCDRASGLAPFMIVATAGTTNAGSIDPIQAISAIAEGEGLWLHVDAAWGGGAAFLPRLRSLLAGIDQADSITFDPHKFLSVPRGAGIFLTRHKRALQQTFRIDTAYMPVTSTSHFDVVDPFMTSMQWSRRFIGLKIFLPLLVAGWSGYEAAINHQVAMGDYLRRRLERSGWEVINNSSLPVVCFVDAQHPHGHAAAYLEAICEHVVSSGKAWISTTTLARAQPALRACITNHRTTEVHVDELIACLELARAQASNDFLEEK